MARRDDRRRSATPGAMISSAALLTRDRTDIPRNVPWQSTSWAYYDTNGELRFATRWNGNALSRARLMAARRPASAGDEPIPAVPGDLAFDLVESLAGGVGRQSQMLRSFGTHLIVPGEGYLVGTAGADGQEWGVYSAEEIRAQGEQWFIQQGPELQDLVPLEDEHLVCRIWTPHERFHWLADSPTRGALIPLREINDMNDHIHAAAQSRLAGAGVLIIPTETELPIDPAFANEADPITAMFMAIAATAIANRESPAALVPIILRMPGQFIEFVKHLTFATPLDEKAIEVREAAIRRAAAAMDLPAEVILGLGDVNHWGSWQIEESALKMHIEPELEAICAGLTVGFLWPSMRAIAAQAGRDAGDVDEWIVWYDVSELTQRPDNSTNVMAAYDRLEANGGSLRRELGLSESDKPTPDELKVMLLRAIIQGAPTMAPALLPLLGIDAAGLGTAPGEGIVVAPPVPPAPGPDVPEGERTLPDTGDTPPGDVSGPMQAAALQAAADALAIDAREQALLAAADAMVLRALERAGAMLRTHMNGKGTIPAGTPTEAIHCNLGVSATTVMDLDRLLKDAWVRVPEIADRYECDPEPLTAALDTYTRALIAASQAHSWERLTNALGGSIANLPPTSAVTFA